MPVPELRSFKEDDRTKSKSTKSKFRKFLDGSSKKKFKFPGNNIKTVIGPDLSRQLLISDNDEDGLTTVTLRTTMSHFSVTPSPTSKGIFEVCFQIQMQQFEGYFIWLLCYFIRHWGYLKFLI